MPIWYIYFNISNRIQKLFVFILSTLGKKCIVLTIEKVGHDQPTCRLINSYAQVSPRLQGSSSSSNNCSPYLNFSAYQYMFQFQLSYLSLCQVLYEQGCIYYVVYKLFYLFANCDLNLSNV